MRDLLAILFSKHDCHVIALDFLPGVLLEQGDRLLLRFITRFCVDFHALTVPKTNVSVHYIILHIKGLPGNGSPGGSYESKRGGLDSHPVLEKITTKEPEMLPFRVVIVFRNEGMDHCPVSRRIARKNANLDFHHYSSSGTNTKNAMTNSP